jgi:predicted nucleic acid-binding protein
MVSAVVDSNVLIAARLERDQHHVTGREILRGIDTGVLPHAGVPSHVVAEVLEYVHTRAGHPQAVETLDAIAESAALRPASSAGGDGFAGRALFRVYDSLSFTDAVLAAYAKRTGTRYRYSFDDDFDAVPWVTRLNAAVTPLS